MDRKLPVASLLSLTIAALLGGCGGSDSADKTPDPVAPSTKNLEVRAIDGYLKGAQVWLDVNGDNLLTAGEPNEWTDGSGKATLDVTKIDHPEQYRVLVQAIANKTTDVGDGTGTNQGKLTNVIGTGATTAILISNAKWVSSAASGALAKISLGLGG